jgi:hypothetical protein
MIFVVVCMKYYDEDLSGNLRLRLEKEIIDWPDVATKKMFGCPCYMVNEKIFVFLVTNGIVITQLNPDEIKDLKKLTTTEYFQAGKRTVKKWTKIQVTSAKELVQLFPYIKMSYNSLNYD